MKSKLKTLLLIILFQLLAIISYGGTIDPNNADEKYIEYGSKFHSVVKLCCFDGKGLSCGSAVVIDPHWIITAAHVVENCHSWTVSIGQEKFNIKNIIIHHNYKSNIFGYNDIALGYMEIPIKLENYPKIYNTNDEMNKVCAIAGWGFTGTFETGVRISDGKKRAGSNIIDRIERGVLVCSASKKQQKTTQLEYLICSGDSGGGLFINNKLAGINSSVIGNDGKSDSTYGDESCHTRLSLHNEWIEKYIKP
jgi:secreted trypsin-like serine protease